MSDKLIEIFASVLMVEPETLTDASNRDNTPNWESLTGLALVNVIEETYETELGMDDMQALQCVGTTRNLLRERGFDV